MTLPTEIYLEIIGYITHRPTLVALLLTSRLLNQVAEVLLYRKLHPNWSTLRSGQPPALLLHLSTCSRVAQHVRSFEIKVDADSAGEVLRLLTALNNLKRLALWQQSSLETHLAEQGYLSSLISGISFQLREFSTNFPVDRHLKLFLQSQLQITILKILFTHNLSEPNLTLSRADLPALTTLSYSSKIPPIGSLFPESFITNLNLSPDVFPTTPLPSVRALFTYSDSVLSSLPYIFPNLRFLQTGFAYLIGSDNLDSLPRLQKLKIQLNVEFPNPIAMAFRIYTSHENLKSVELCWQRTPDDQVTVYRAREQFNSQIMEDTEPVSEICDEDPSFHYQEWETWQG